MLTGGFQDYPGFVRSTDCPALGILLAWSVQLLWGGCHAHHYRGRPFPGSGCWCRQHLYIGTDIPGNRLWLCRRYI